RYVRRLGISTARCFPAVAFLLPASSVRSALCCASACSLQPAPPRPCRGRRRSLWVAPPPPVRYSFPLSPAPRRESPSPDAVPGLLETPSGSLPVRRENAPAPDDSAAESRHEPPRPQRPFPASARPCALPP